MMKGKKIYTKLSILIIVIMLMAGTQVFAATVGKVSGVATTPSTNSVTVRWSTLSGATQYQVSIYIPGIGYVDQSLQTGTSRTITGLDAGTQYKVKVRGYKSGTYGTWSNEVTFKTTSSNSGGGTSATPATVSGLKTTSIKENSVVIAYNKATNASKYEIYFGTSTSNMQRVATTTATSATINSLTAGTRYYVKVRAVSSAGKYGSFSTNLSITTAKATTNVGKVSGVSATAGGTDRITVKWSSLSGVTQYQVSIYIPGIGYVDQSLQTGTSRTITGLDAGTQYKVKVRAYKDGVYGAWSNEATVTTTKAATVGKVSGVSATAGGTDRVTVKWSSLSGVTQYQVSIYIPGIGYVDQSLQTGTNRTITGLDAGTQYKVKVRAYSNGKYGDWSNEATVTTTKTAVDTAPAQIKNLKTTSITADTITFTFSSDANAAKYQIYYGTTTSNMVSAGYVTGTSVKLGNLKAGTKYYIKVRGISSQGKEGTFSSNLTATTAKASNIAVGTVSGVSATAAGTDKITVKWNSLSGITNYQVSINIPGIGYVDQSLQTGTSRTISGLDAGTAYQVKVRAYSNGTYGAWSNVATATTTKTAADTAPAQIKNLKTTGIAASTITFAFDSDANAAKYQIYYGTSVSGMTSAGYVSGTKVRLSNLKAGTKYYIKVRGISAGGKEGTFSTNLAVTTSKTTIAVGTVSGVSATAGGTDRITVKWSALSGITQYQVSIYIPGIGYVDQGLQTGTSRTITGLDAGTQYKVKVRAYNNGVYGSWSNEATATTTKSGNNNGAIGQVSNIKVTNIKDTSALVSWNAVAGATQYQVYYRLENQTLGLSRTTTGTSMQITGLASGTAYCVNVKAIKGNVSGNYNDNPTKFTTLQKAAQTTTKPALVSNIAVSNITDTTATVTWSAVSGATKYYVYYRLSNQNQGYAIATTQTSAKLTGLASGTAYCVNVKAMNGNVSGDYNGSPKTFTTQQKAASQANFYNGTYELPVQGATGWASIKLNIREKATSNSTLLGTVAAGNSFTILSQEGDWFKVRFQNQSTGYVYAPYVLLNLPDVIPSIVYYDSNSASSLFKSSGVSIDNITGNQLYNVYNNNSRLGEYQYDMPVLYGMAARIAQAQKAALAEGYSLKIYESFRPYDTQTSIAKAVQNLMNNNSTVAKGIKVDGWSIGWFIATGTSNHQQGIAIDVSLVKVNSMQTKTTGNYKYNVVGSYSELQMPTAMHELSVAAARYTTSSSGKYAASMNDNAKLLEKYCKNAGLTGLASEWWHFNDNTTLNSIPTSCRSNGQYRLQPNVSIQP